MANFSLSDVDVQFSVYGTRALSFRRLAFQKTVGGLIGHNVSGPTTVTALKSVNLHARDGDRIALLGHNGAGKTTLLRVLSGIYAPTRGIVKLTGRRMSLFEINLGFEDEATGYENIILRGLVMGLTRKEIAKYADRIAEFSGLGEFLSLPLRTYSAGMTFRLMFAIATSIEADILLMDEWIATGDKDFLQKADDRLHAIVERSSILVIATHNLPLVKRLCNRALILHGGQVVADGPVDHVVGEYIQMQ